MGLLTMIVDDEDGVYGFSAHNPIPDEGEVEDVIVVVSFESRVEDVDAVGVLEPAPSHNLVQRRRCHSSVER
jgi:hypothetical protein